MHHTHALDLLHRPHSSSHWWEKSVIYQVYPRSFYDSNHDGVGDLEGIIRKLDYLNDGTPKSLGVDAIWLSPVYPSPMKDHGYDVSNYLDIDPTFGNLKTFDRLVKEASKRNIKIIMDLVVNHTSDQHPWFLESRSSLDNPKRSWYVWRDPHPDGGPPNNWQSFFGGSAWTYDEHTNQYYLHKFLAEQPDLNNWNPQVNQAVIQILHYWLKRGVAGFRMDVVDRLLFDLSLDDVPLNPLYNPDCDDPSDKYDWVKSYYHPEVHKIIAVIRKVLDLYRAVGIGEVHAINLDYITNFYAQGHGLHLPFNFHLINLPWDATTVAKHIADYEAHLKDCAWPNYVLGNHDNARLSNRIGEHYTRLAAVLLLTLRGTPFIYYGDEIGLSHMNLHQSQWQDPHHTRIPSSWSRDMARGPMQWSAELHAGFSENTPWLPTNEHVLKENVASQHEDSSSLLNLYRRLIWLRKESPALLSGAIELLEKGEDDLIVYRRHHGSQSMLVLLNFSATIKSVYLDAYQGRGRLRLRSHSIIGNDDIVKVVHLQPREACILEQG